MDSDPNRLRFHNEVDDMTMAEYLRQAREDHAEWTADFRTRYSITAQATDDHFSAEDMYEANSHHAEYAPATH